VLSDWESRKLAQLEDQLSNEDPDLARSLVDGKTPRRRGRWPYTTALIVAVVVLGLCLLAALPIAA
jgi:cytoskeletal protein RodZ